MSIIRPIIDELEATSQRIGRQLSEHPAFVHARAKIAEAQEALRAFDEGRWEPKRRKN